MAQAHLLPPSGATPIKISPNKINRINRIISSKDSNLIPPPSHMPTGSLFSEENKNQISLSFKGLN